MGHSEDSGHGTKKTWDTANNYGAQLIRATENRDGLGPSRYGAQRRQWAWDKENLGHSKYGG